VPKVGTCTLNADKAKVHIATYDVNSHMGHKLQGMGSKSIEAVWCTSGLAPTQRSRAPSHLAARASSLLLPFTDLVPILLFSDLKRK